MRSLHPTLGLLAIAVACSPAAPAPAAPAVAPSAAVGQASVALPVARSPPRNGAECPRVASAKVDMLLGGSCASDADCSGGERQRPRCAHTPTLVGPGKPKPGPQVRACVVDACLTDGDCPSGELCFCGAGVAATNRCAPSQCKADGDCSSGQTCQADPGPPGPPPSITYGMPYRRCR